MLSMVSNRNVIFGLDSKLTDLSLQGKADFEVKKQIVTRTLILRILQTYCKWQLLSITRVLAQNLISTLASIEIREKGNKFYLICFRKTRLEYEVQFE